VHRRSGRLRGVAGDLCSRKHRRRPRRPRARARRLGLARARRREASSFGASIRRLQPRLADCRSAINSPPGEQPPSLLWPTVLELRSPTRPSARTSRPACCPRRCAAPSIRRSSMPPSRACRTRARSSGCTTTAARRCGHARPVGEPPRRHHHRAAGGRHLQNVERLVEEVRARLVQRGEHARAAHGGRPQAGAGTVTTPVDLRQVAPTILKALHLDAGALQAVQLEGTQSLPLPSDTQK